MKTNLVQAITKICTNNFPDRLEGLKINFELNNYFDVIVTSYEIGITKPDPAILKYLAYKLTLSPHEIVVSDDREEMSQY